MKLTPLVAVAICQIAFANTYPDFTSTSNMLIQSEVIRQRMAPFYGEVPNNTIEVKNIGISLEQYSVQEIFERNSNVLKPIQNYIGLSTVDNTSQKLIAGTPEFSIDTFNNQQKIVESLTLNENLLLVDKNITGINPINNAQTPSRTLAQTSGLDIKSVAFNKNITGINPINNAQTPSRTITETYLNETGALIDKNITGINPINNNQTALRLFSSLSETNVTSIDKNITGINPINNTQTPSRTLAQTVALNIKSAVVKTKNITQIATLYLPDAFALSMEFDWKKPYGQFMNQLLKDIQIAKQEGNTEKYKKLTAQYQAWADEYLIKGTPTRVMK